MKVMTAIFSFIAPTSRTKASSKRLSSRLVRRFFAGRGAGFATTAVAFTFVLLAPAGLAAQKAATPAPDTVTFEDGEKVIGNFEGLLAGAAKFKSDKLGEITIDLSKIQELHTSERFAVVRKGVKLTKGETDRDIPQGTIAIQDQTVQVDPGNGQAMQTVPLKEVSDIVPEKVFLAGFQSPGILHGWKGAISLDAALVEATQNSVSVSSSVNLVRAMPPTADNWLPPSNRTLIAFSDSYGEVTQPNTPTVKTSIYHAAAERDEYFGSALFVFGSTAFDHNFSQGLDLQQLYGGGLGWSIIKQAKQTLDLKASVDYEKQSFLVASLSHNLINSVFAENYTRTFVHGIALTQQLSASPAWNQSNAYSAYASAGLVFPVYKRFGFNVNAIDSFLNDPAPGFKKNSVQFTTGVTYTLP